MRIGIVNDSRIACEVLARTVRSLPGFSVLWTAHDGREAIEMCAQDLPDIVLMDLIMPHVDGAQATREIMRETPCVILVVTSSVTAHRDKVFEAMGYGALDAVTTPVMGPDGSLDGDEALKQKLRVVSRLVNIPAPIQVTALAKFRAHAPGHAPVQTPIVAIGASTGGPQALGIVLAALPENFPAAVLIVQHMDAHFAPGFAEWLQQHCVLPIRLAHGGEKAAAGTVWLAGRDKHMYIDDDGIVVLSKEPENLHFRPSVDVLFTNLAECRKMERLGVLLTGMGSDGAEGLLALRKSGAHTIAQDASSSIVYGMPKMAAERSAATEILPLKAIGPRIVKFFMKDSSVEHRVASKTVPE
jgi:two-component system, chemotaxis family, response regulator WspF